MNAGWLAAIVAAVTACAGWLVAILRLLWTIRGRWDETNATLLAVKDEIKNLREQDSRLEKRLHSHLSWHARQGIRP